MDFLAKFKKICEGIHNPAVEVIPAARYDAPVQKRPVKLFNIHKRSLPPGIDAVVLIGLTKSEAEHWLSGKLKARIFHDDARESKTLIYYDMLPQDAIPRERSIYHNPAGVCVEAFPDFKRPHRIN